MTTTDIAAIDTQYVEQMRHHTLRNLHDAAHNLRQSLITARNNAERALSAIANGERVSGMAIGTGPLGHQNPADIVKQTAIVESLLQQAQMLGCSQSDITAAYTQS